MANMKKRDKSYVSAAAIAIAFGTFSLLVALGALPISTKNDSPTWAIGMIGVMFCIAGVMILLRNHTRVLDFLAAQPGSSIGKNIFRIGCTNVLWWVRLCAQTPLDKLATSPG